MMFMSLKPAGSVGQVADGHPHCFETSKVTKGSPDVFFEGYPAARVGDPVAPHSGTCSKHGKPHSRKVDTGSPTVFANGMQVTREGDMVKCDTGQTAALLDGRPTVLIGAKSQVPKSTVEGDALPNAMPNINSGSPEVVGGAPSDAKPGDGPTLMAGRGGRPPPLTLESIRGRAKEIRVPRPLVNQIEELWRKTWAGKETVEYGAAVAADPSGRLYLNRATKGTAAAVLINRQVDSGSRVIGTVHTHPDPDLYGQITLQSGGDLAAQMITGDMVCIVRTGSRTVSMVVRTSATPSDVDYDELKKEADMLVNRLWDGGRNTSWEDANRRVLEYYADKYNLVLYRGQVEFDGKIENASLVLRRVN